MTAAVAAVPALVVVCTHLAFEWHQHGGSAERQSLAFDHGIALAAILGLVLIAGRVALALDGATSHPAADGVAIAGVLVVLAHLASVWKDEGMGTSSWRAVLEHLAVLLTVAAVALLVRRREDARR
jgi:hypothetical protein